MAVGKDGNAIFSPFRKLDPPKTLRRITFGGNVVANDEISLFSCMSENPHQNNSRKKENSGDLWFKRLQNQGLRLYLPTIVTQKAACQEEENSRPGVESFSTASIPHPTHKEQKLQAFLSEGTRQEQLAHHNREELENESCSSCLVVGVMTCTWLTAYFGHLAYEDWAKAITTTTTTKSVFPVLGNLLQRRPPFSSFVFGGVSVAWACAGLYRYQLG